MNKIIALLDALRAGAEVANPAVWKVRQNAINAILATMGALVALASAYGVQVAISQDDMLTIAGGIFAALGVGNAVITTVTTKKIGLGDHPVTPPEQAP